MSHSSVQVSTKSEPATIGERISVAREHMHLTTAQLARRIGVRTETLSSWETDRSEPRANRLVMLAGLLNVTPAWLLEGHGGSPSTELRPDNVVAARNELIALKDELSSMVDRVSRVIERLEREGDSSV